MLPSVFVRPVIMPRKGHNRGHALSLAIPLQPVLPATAEVYASERVGRTMWREACLRLHPYDASITIRALQWRIYR